VTRQIVSGQVVLGHRALLEPNTDPGVVLAREVCRPLATYPGPLRVIYLANHGRVALGTSQVQALQITKMNCACQRRTPGRSGQFPLVIEAPWSRGARQTGRRQPVDSGRGETRCGTACGWTVGRRVWGQAEEQGSPADTRTEGTS
jgi:hypothetical protein